MADILVNGAENTKYGVGGEFVLVRGASLVVNF